jgi:hypothetical protein
MRAVMEGVKKEEICRYIKVLQTEIMAWEAEWEDMYERKMRLATAEHYLKYIYKEK